MQNIIVVWFKLIYPQRVFVTENTIMLLAMSLSHCMDMEG